MGKVHWAAEWMSVHAKVGYAYCGSGYYKNAITTDPAKVTCKHPACQKAAAEAKGEKE